LVEQAGLKIKSLAIVCRKDAGTEADVKINALSRPARYLRDDNQPEVQLEKAKENS
jgi:hypothetical protein